MKKAAILVALAALAPSAGATPFGDFRNLATSGTLKPFALDLGGVLGGAAFHSGRVLGLPGFDVGVVGTFQSRPDKEDVILRDAGVQRFAVPMVQAEVGLPLNFDLIVHGITGQGARIFGGGIRYGIHKSGILSILPDVAVSAFGDKINHTYFGATHYSLNAVASFNLPVVHPYAGLGWDYTKVTVGDAAIAGLVGTTATARGTRLTAGLDMNVIPLPLLKVRVHAAYTVLHGLPGLDLGAGVRF